jgi:hypothetical protein
MLRYQGGQVKRLFSLLAILVLSSCASTEVKSPPAAASTTGASDPGKAPIERRIYFYQHKLLPNWTFTTDGAFFRDLKNGELARLRSAASEIVSAEYSAKISATNIPQSNAVLITFEEPTTPPACFFALIRETGSKYYYLTYEKTLDISNAGYIGVVGGWSADGSHCNYGSRTYSDRESFISDAIRISDSN